MGAGRAPGAPLIRPSPSWRRSMAIADGLTNLNMENQACSGFLESVDTPLAGAMVVNDSRVPCKARPAPCSTPPPRFRGDSREGLGLCKGRLGTHDVDLIAAMR